MKSKLTIMPNPQTQTYTQVQENTEDLILSYCCHFEVCPKCAAENVILCGKKKQKFQTPCISGNYQLKIKMYQMV